MGRSWLIKDSQLKKIREKKKMTTKGKKILKLYKFSFPPLNIESLILLLSGYLMHKADNLISLVSRDKTTTLTPIGATGKGGGRPGPL